MPVQGVFDPTGADRIAAALGIHEVREIISDLAALNTASRIVSYCLGILHHEVDVLPVTEHRSGDMINPSYEELPSFKTVVRFLGTDKAEHRILYGLGYILLIKEHLHFFSKQLLIPLQPSQEIPLAIGPWLSTSRSSKSNCPIAAKKLCIS